VRPPPFDGSGTQLQISCVSFHSHSFHTFPCSQHYRCQKRYVLYDTVVTSDEGDVVFVNTTGGSADAFDIDLEAGAVTGQTGICVDIDVRSLANRTRQVLNFAN